MHSYAQLWTLNESITSVLAAIVSPDRSGDIEISIYLYLWKISKAGLLKRNSGGNAWRRASDDPRSCATATRPSLLCRKNKMPRLGARCALETRWFKDPRKLHKHVQTLNCVCYVCNIICILCCLLKRIYDIWYALRRYLQPLPLW